MGGGYLCLKCLRSLSEKFRRVFSGVKYFALMKFINWQNQKVSEYYELQNYNVVLKKIQNLLHIEIEKTDQIRT